jgi:hypothetical protein
MGGVWQSDMNPPIVILRYYGVGGACPLQFLFLRGIYAWLLFNAGQGCKPVNCTQSHSYRERAKPSPAKTDHERLPSSAIVKPLPNEKLK